MPDIQLMEPKLNELLTRDMVDISVGPEKTSWYLHEKLLTHHSPYFARTFSKRSEKSHSLPDEDCETFQILTSWLYSTSLPLPREEKDLDSQFALYFLASKLEISPLATDVMQNIREWYKDTDSYPSLRRVQYVYANTEDGDTMRKLLVHAVARQMVLEDGMPSHWEKALKRGGEWVVDLIKAIQEWRLEGEVVPDVRVEGDDEVVDEMIDEGLGEEGEGIDVDDETVVESPDEKEVAKEGKDAPKSVKQKADRAFVKAEVLGEMPNGISVGDYGSLA